MTGETEPRSEQMLVIVASLLFVDRGPPNALKSPELSLENKQNSGYFW